MSGRRGKPGNLRSPKPVPPVFYHEGRFPPDQRLDWQRLIPLLGPAYSAVARYDGMLSAVPDPSILLAPLSTQEAVLSSRIEGTQATMGQVLEFEARGETRSPTRRDDILEVIQYRRAMWHAERTLREVPLSLRVIRESHRVLLASGRGNSAHRACIGVSRTGSARLVAPWKRPRSFQSPRRIWSTHERLGTIHAPGRTRRLGPTCDSTCRVRGPSSVSGR